MTGRRPCVFFGGNVLGHVFATGVRLRGAAFCVLAVAGLAACGDILTGAAEPASIRVTLGKPSLTTGDSTPVTLVVLDAGGRTLSGAPDRLGITVGTTDPGILLIRGGHAVALGSGAVEVVAEAKTGATGRAPVRVHPRELRLDVAAVLNQVIQRADGSIPIVPGRAALLQLFVTADRPNFFDLPEVRVRIFQDEEEVLVTDLPGSPDVRGVPLAPVESGRAPFYRLHLPAEWVHPGLGVVIEPDPHGRLPHAAASLRRFPAEGTPLRFGFDPMPPFDVRFVPVHRAGLGTGEVSEENVDRFLEVARAILPLGDVTRDVRAPFTTETDVFDVAGLITELKLLQAAEGGPHHYYGIMKSTTGGAYLNDRVAVSYDFDHPIAALTVAHELGHNFGRLHPPCLLGDPWVDTGYPYENATIGAWGYDPGSRTLYGATDAHDIMGTACGSPIWISDYNFRPWISTGESTRTAAAGGQHTRPPRACRRCWSGAP